MTIGNDLDNKFTEIDDKHADTDAKFAATTETLAAINSKLAEINDRLTDTGTKLDAHDRRLDDLERGTPIPGGTPIELNSIVPLYNTIGIVHDFGGLTQQFVMRVNGQKAFPLTHNPIDGKHYGTAWVAESRENDIEIIDVNGERRTAQATSLTTPTRPTPVRQRHVSPDVAPGAGDYSEGNPGNLADALGSERAGDEVVLHEGTKPYHIGELAIGSSATNLTLVAAPGELPVWSGAREGSISWTNEGGGIYSTTDFDPSMRQLHAKISGNVERFAKYSNLAGLQSANHGWTIASGELHVKLSSNPLSHVAVDPSTTEVFIPANFPSLLKVFADGFWCEGITFEFAGAGSGNFGRGLIISADNIVLRNCTIRHIQQIGARLTQCNGILIEGCSFLEPQDYKTYDQIKLGSEKTESSSQLNLSGVTRCTVRNCTFLGQMDAIRIDDRNGSFATEEVNLHDCTFRDCRGETIDIEGTLRQVRRWNNRLTNTHHQIALATGFGGPFWIVNEQCTGGGYLNSIDLAGPNDKFFSQGTKFNSNRTGQIGQLFMVNNTFDSSFGTRNDFKVARCWSVERNFPMGSAYCRNTIWSGLGHPFHDENAEGVYDFDHNLYWTTEDPQTWKWMNNDVSSFVDFQSASGQEANGEFSDPELSNGLPSSTLPGTDVPGITGNKLFRSLEADKGAQ